MDTEVDKLAWTAIKATTAEEQRTLWREVGVALVYRNVAINRPQQGVDSRGEPRVNAAQSSCH